MKNFINKTLANTLGYHFTKYRSRKDKIFETQQQLCVDIKRPTIFDVGAFTGETALIYNKYFKNQCEIYSFEPYENSFLELKKHTSAFENIKPFNIALGNNDELAQLHVNNFLATNSFLPSDPDGVKAWGVGLLETKTKVDVPMQTIDIFIREHKINQIDILKMDTQGSEYLVLEGAEKSMKAGKIKIIFAEIIVMPTYTGQMDLDEIFRMYKNYGFELYSLFNSKGQNEKLKYMDGIFIHNSMTF